MRLILTKHVEYRLAQRDITESDLVAIIRHPQKPRRDDEGNPIYVGIVRGWDGTRGGCEQFDSSACNHSEGDTMSNEQVYPYTTYDAEADAAYVYLRSAPWAYMEIIDDYRNIDFAADGMPVGVEFLYVSKGINLDGLPAQDVLVAQLEPLHLKVFA